MSLFVVTYPSQLVKHCQSSWVICRVLSEAIASARETYFSRPRLDSRVGRLIYAGSDALEPLQVHLEPRLDQLAPGEVVLGKNFAEALGVEVGQPLVALIAEESSHRRFLPETLRLAAVLDSGTEIDSVFALAPMTPASWRGYRSRILMGPYHCGSAGGASIGANASEALRS